MYFRYYHSIISFEIIIRTCYSKLLFEVSIPDYYSILLFDIIIEIIIRARAGGGRAGTRENTANSSKQVRG